MGTHLKVLRENFPMYTNMIGLRCFAKTFASLRQGLVLLAKVASALKGLISHTTIRFLAHKENGYGFFSHHLSCMGGRIWLQESLGSSFEFDLIANLSPAKLTATNTCTWVFKF